jgi:hypothetical protein
MNDSGTNRHEASLSAAISRRSDGVATLAEG